MEYLGFKLVVRVLSFTSVPVSNAGSDRQRDLPLLVVKHSHKEHEFISIAPRAMIVPPQHYISFILYVTVSWIQLFATVVISTFMKKVLSKSF